MLILILYSAIGGVLTGMSGTEIRSACWIVLFVECRFWTSERSTARRVNIVSGIGAAMVAGVLDAPSCIFEIVIVIICGGVALSSKGTATCGRQCYLPNRWNESCPRFPPTESSRDDRMQYSENYISPILESLLNL